MILIDLAMVVVVVMVVVGVVVAMVVVDVVVMVVVDVEVMVVVDVMVVSVLLTVLVWKRTAESSSSDLSVVSGAVYARAHASAFHRCVLLHPAKSDIQIFHRVASCTSVVVPYRFGANNCIYHLFPFSYVP